MHPPSTPTGAGLSTAAPTLPTLTRLADYAVMTLAVVLSVGSIALFAWESRPILVPLHWSPAGAAWWNAAVSFVFFAQHSVTVRRPFRARLAAVIPARYDGAFYAITSGIALALVVLLWQPAGTPMFVLHGVPRVVIDIAALAAIAGFAWGARALHGFDPCGLRPVRAHLRGASPAPIDTTARATPLVVRGPYRWVRHPLYSCVIVLLWADADMTPGRLVVAASWTAWICVGALLEEQDLISEFGDRYRSYRRQVPFLVPWRRPVAAHEEESETSVTT